MKDKLQNRTFIFNWKSIQTRVWIVFFPVMVFLLWLIIRFNAVDYAGEGKVLYWLVFAVFLSPSLYCLLSYKNRALTVSGEGITYTNLIGQTDIYSWDDIKWITTSSGRIDGIKICAKGGHVIHISGDMKDFGILYCICRYYDTMDDEDHIKHLAAETALDQILEREDCF